MAEMTAAEAAVRILESEGVRHLFGIPGTAVLPVYRALKALGTIRHVIARHEEGALHMADGDARAAGGVGVCIATSGRRQRISSRDSIPPRPIRFRSWPSPASMTRWGRESSRPWTSPRSCAHR
jgi:hypothetical protein